MEKGRYRIVFNSTDVDSADSLEEVVSAITSAIKNCTSSAAEQGLPLSPDEFYETVTNRFIIIDQETHEEYDGSGFPISGKYVLTKGNISKKLNARSLSEAIEYLFEVAAEECEWLRMIKDDVNPSDVINEYSIINTKTALVYNQYGEGIVSP